jgi:autotransporter passenger strand-loop-strand repeat protein
LATTSVTSAQSNTTITSGNVFDVLSGASITSDTIQNGGSAIIEVGATGTATKVQAGGTEVVYGSVSSDTIAGTVVASAASGVATSVAVLLNETVTSGGTLELFLKGAVASGTTVSGGGSLQINGSAYAANTTLVSGGALILESGKSTISGTVTFVGADTLQYTAIVSSSTSTGDQAVLSNFLPGDVVDVTVIGTGATLTTTSSGGNTIETITSGAVSEAFIFGGAYTSGYFSLVADATSGVQIVGTGTPCYCPGTLIDTQRGEVAVEALAIGDNLRTLSGALRPIKWIGRRSYGGRFAAGQTQILPVRIAAGALADGQPRRDLFVSPLHAMLLDGVLVPALQLVNGTSIVQLTSVERVDYVHVELDSHDVILAEGAPSETFVDDESRGMFHNAAEFAALYPDAVREAARYCAPRIEDGPQLDTIRRRIAARATPALAAWGALQGSVDVVARGRIAGWARDAAAPDQAVRLHVTADGVVLCEVVADQYRPDLVAAGLGTGRHGFDVVVPGGVPAAASIRIVRVADGAAMPEQRVA